MKVTFKYRDGGRMKVQIPTPLPPTYIIPIPIDLSDYPDDDISSHYPYREREFYLHKKRNKYRTWYVYEEK